MASPQVAGVIACYFDTDSSTFGAVTTKANQESAKAFIQGNGDIDGAITDWGDDPTHSEQSLTPIGLYNCMDNTAGALTVHEQP